MTHYTSGQSFLGICSIGLFVKPMLDIFDNIAKLVQSPPGFNLRLVRFWRVSCGSSSKRVEAVLTDQTKLEIAVWLLGVKVGQKVEPWPGNVSDRVWFKVFGKQHFNFW